MSRCDGRGAAGILHGLLLNVLQAWGYKKVTTPRAFGPDLMVD